MRGRLTRRKTVQYSATAWVPAHSKVECGAPGLENTLGYEMSPLGTPWQGTWGPCTVFALSGNFIIISYYDVSKARTSQSPERGSAPWGWGGTFGGGAGSEVRAGGRGAAVPSPRAITWFVFTFRVSGVALAPLPPHSRFLFGTRWSEAWARVWPCPAGGPCTPVVCPRRLQQKPASGAVLGLLSKDELLARPCWPWQEGPPVPRASPGSLGPQGRGRTTLRLTRASDSAPGCVPEQERGQGRRGADQALVLRRKRAA